MHSAILIGIIVLVCVSALGIIVYGSARIQSGIFVKAICHLPKIKEGSESASTADKRCEYGSTSGILLTFDDGPDPDITPLVLDVLDRYGVHAIFFVIGSKAKAHPELLQQIVSRGHTVGNHSFNHSPYANFLGARHLEGEIRACDEAIHAALGPNYPIVYFRPPLGITTHYMQRVLSRTGHVVMGWSVRSLDTLDEPRSKVLSRIEKHLETGSIVLLHDRLEGADWLADQTLSLAKRRGYI